MRKVGVRSHIHECQLVEVRAYPETDLPDLASLKCRGKRSVSPTLLSRDVPESRRSPPNAPGLFIARATNRLGSSADVVDRMREVRFTPQSRHADWRAIWQQCANSGHPLYNMTLSRHKKSTAVTQRDLQLPHGASD